MAHAEAAIEPIQELVVTAQKREQGVESIGMSITAASAETLSTRGIDAVADLPRLVPGLTLQDSNFGSTSFNLRGVGFFNSDLATPPAVTVYLDEAPLPYPAMARLVAFDLERVEVLKGPQGTLFGQNATGGAVNYIAAAPRQVAEIGVEATYGRFDRVRTGGYITGPLSDTLTGRIAVQGRWGDGWQKSITRPGDRLGRIDELQGRAALEWRPSARVVSRLTLTLTHDGGESLAGQFYRAAPIVPALAVPGLLSFPSVSKPRAADWSLARVDTGEPFPYASDTTFLQARLRNEYRLGDDITLTTLSSFAYLDLAYGQDANGTPFDLNEVVDDGGKISSTFQEARLAGRRGRVTWLAGINYAHDRVKDQPLQTFRDVDLAHLYETLDPQAYADVNLLSSRVRVNTYAAFGRVEIQVSEALMVEGAMRYNIDRRRFDSCVLAPSDHFARFWNFFRNGAQPATRVGDCTVLDPANDLRPVDNVQNRLNEDSLSWRVGLTWTARPGLIAYVNASKGYKAGAVPVAAVSTVTQFDPIGQETLVAYEGGVKAALFDRRLQVNASAFYYDYRDKQLRGAFEDPAFGPLEALVSIPRSHVVGAEAQVVARPIDGLTLDTAVTWLHTNVDRFIGADGLARFGDQAGTPFPFSPAWQAVGNLDYAVSISERARGFVGGTVTYRSRTYAGLGAPEPMRIGAYTLVDLRAGVESADGQRKGWIWGRNVTNAYSWSNVFLNANVISRFVGQPATYGVTVSGRF
ncbi:MAG: TonB-dependent receptor [Alphaproteobacteria bacterium]|nr:TonB-dependent receptor [Alphaproteobacteria bacterium]MBU1515157.1 TonB-dependent receptor [Alphaproteobacteria bacterium]MBU2092287.1 TonB-dependent receptor [Alphaproteobacteria bacterium]MBU2152881.1 TonB-dependent receptor [Alphaproteobacteria bacterium]MBU2305712.1 TonB-dependent receptor [Alphaproteobacteria bacterium]